MSLGRNGNIWLPSFQGSISLGRNSCRLLNDKESTRQWVWSLCWGDPLEKEMATHSSFLAWRIPWLRSLEGYSPWGSQRVRHGHTHTHMPAQAHSLLLSVSCHGIYHPRCVPSPGGRCTLMWTWQGLLCSFTAPASPASFLLVTSDLWNFLQMTYWLGNGRSWSATAKKELEPMGRGNGMGEGKRTSVQHQNKF